MLTGGAGAGGESASSGSDPNRPRSPEAQPIPPATPVSKSPCGTGKSEDRLKSLLKLLITRLGKRTAEGYKLQFLLSHSRLAEMIGTTRSTVSRSLGALRSKGIISIDEMKEELITNDSELIATTATRTTFPL